MHFLRDVRLRWLSLLKDAINGSPYCVCSIAVETSRSTSQSDSIVRQTNKRSFPILQHDEQYSDL